MDLYPFEMFCAIWCHSCNLKNVKNNHEGVLPLVKLQALACNLTKSNTSSWVFFKDSKLRKWYQIAQSVSYDGHNGLEHVEVSYFTQIVAVHLLVTLNVFFFISRI